MISVIIYELGAIELQRTLLSSCFILLHTSCTGTNVKGAYELKVRVTYALCMTLFCVRAIPFEFLSGAEGKPKIKICGGI